MKIGMRILLALAAVWGGLSCRYVQAQESVQGKPLNRILLIYDASNSMNARWQSASKMTISKRLIAEIVDSLSMVDNVQLALRVYGHQSHYPPLDCNDSKLEVPFAPNNGKRISHVIKSLVPKGATPIAYSLTEAAKDFPPCDNCRNLIILVTDGIEECGGDPCEASRYLQKQGIALKPFIIGIGKDFSHDFYCVGEYFDASNEEDFVRAFEIVISQALNSTTAQVNLLDADGLPTVSNLNMTFYDHVSGDVLYNYVHTLDYYGRPDTLTLDPLHVYDLQVNTFPPLRMDSIAVHTGRHNLIAMKAVQGNLAVSMKGSRASVAGSIPCVV
ncbi:MAG: VWA domain-containing protein, partial [Bacteroidales bacterium]|nr:VWA domain-containing protein [Bacteroidales bacterium]